MSVVALLRTFAAALVLFAYMAQPSHAQTTSANFGPITYLHNDVTGNVIMGTDPSGGVLWEERYLPYGMKRLGSAGSHGTASSSSQRYGYHNKSLDPESGLQYFGGRYYDPLSGRFNGIDPAASIEADIYTFNRYGFANGNPYRYTDPSGHNVLSIVDWYYFAHDAGQLLVTDIVGVTAMIRGDQEVLNLAVEDMQVQRVDATASTLGVISPVPRSGGIIKSVVRFEKSAKITADAVKDLRRPYLRKSTIEEVYKRAPRDAEGRILDPNTGRPIRGKPDVGHKRGHEFRREKARAEGEGLTQKDFNDRMNDPDLYQLEDPSSNRSHRYEQP
jgi:RHS repeat-associated protein